MEIERDIKFHQTLGEVNNNKTIKDLYQTNIKISAMSFITCFADSFRDRHGYNSIIANTALFDIDFNVTIHKLGLAYTQLNKDLALQMNAPEFRIIFVYNSISNENSICLPINPNRFNIYVFNLVTFGNYLLEKLHDSFDYDLIIFRGFED